MCCKNAKPNQLLGLKHQGPNKYKDLNEIIGASSLKEFFAIQNSDTPKMGSHFPASKGDLFPNVKPLIFQRGSLTLWYQYTVFSVCLPDRL